MALCLVHCTSDYRPGDVWFNSPSGAAIIFVPTVPFCHLFSAAALKGLTSSLTLLRHEHRFVETDNVVPIITQGCFSTGDHYWKVIHFCPSLVLSVRLWRSDHLPFCHESCIFELGRFLAGSQLLAGWLTNWRKNASLQSFIITAPVTLLIN